MKKILSVFLSMLMIASVFAAAIPVGAEKTYAGNVDFSMTNAAGYRNDEITIELKLNSNPGICCFWFLLYYEEDAFILRDVEVNKELTDVGEFFDTPDNVTADRLSGPIAEEVLGYFKDYNISTKDKNFKILFYDYDSIQENMTFTGTVATLTFQIMGIASTGDHTIGIMPGFDNFFNIDFEDISVSWTNATVNVGSETVPPETQEKLTESDTVAPSEITEEPDDPDYADPLADETTTGAGDAANDTKDQTEAPVETFIGEDGAVYYTDENGETVPYEPESDVESDSADAADTDTEPADETRDDVSDTEDETYPEDETVIEKAKEEKKKTGVSIFGHVIPLVWLIVIIVVILLAIAGALVYFIMKAKDPKSITPEKIEKYQKDLAEKSSEEAEKVDDESVAEAPKDEAVNEAVEDSKVEETTEEADKTDE